MSIYIVLYSNHSEQSKAFMKKSNNAHGCTRCICVDPPSVHEYVRKLGVRYIPAMLCIEEGKLRICYMDALTSLYNVSGDELVE